MLRYNHFMRSGKNQWGNRPRIAVPCEVCGKIRMCKPSVIADGKGKYCSKECRAIGIRTHGESIGGISSIEHKTWSSIKFRCLNPKSENFPRYGGRGITICDKWINNFAAFLSDVGRRPSDKHSIERINNNGNYEPGNVRWATKKEQGQNRRDNVVMTFNGETHCIKEWSRITGISERALGYRYKRGLTLQRIFAR
jgi:hypothetical protein